MMQLQLTRQVDGRTVGRPVVWPDRTFPDDVDLGDVLDEYVAWRVANAEAFAAEHPHDPPAAPATRLVLLDGDVGSIESDGQTWRPMLVPATEGA